MYSPLLAIHSTIRWLVLVLMIISIVNACAGFIKNRVFTKADNMLRHWTATAAHIQLVAGIILYTQSPAIKYFWANTSTSTGQFEYLFYAVLHASLMITAIVILTIGSALAKRRTASKEKFRTILIWFSLALLLIFVAVPWPFSPLSNRPYLRTF